MTTLLRLIVVSLFLLASMPSAMGVSSTEIKTRQLQDVNQTALIAEAQETVLEVSTSYQISEACQIAMGTSAAVDACADDAAQLEEEIVSALNDFIWAHGWETAPVWLAEALHRKVDWSRDSPTPSRHLEVPPSRHVQVGHTRRLVTCTTLCSVYGCYCCYWCPKYHCC